MNTMLKTSTNQQEKKLLTVRSMTVIAMLSAVATVLMLFEVPLWFAPNFYKLDLSEVPVLVGTFAMGPLAGLMIEFVKIVINFIIDGSITMGVGEAANFLIGASFIIPAGLIYRRMKTKAGAGIGMIAGTISMSLIGSLMNAVVILPVYAFMLKMPMENLIKAGTAVNPAITNITTFIFFAVVPFNLIKGVVVSIITYALYKNLSIMIKTFTK